jgi:hypothetical protein
MTIVAIPKLYIITTVKGKLVEKQVRKVNRSKVVKGIFHYNDGWAA